jgi:hypothetical protein
MEEENMTVPRQWLGEHIPMAVNTYATIEELLDSVFSIRPCRGKLSTCSERKAGN